MTDRAITSSRRRRRALRFWVIAMLAIVCAAGLRAWQNHQRREHRAAWEKQRAAAREAGNLTFERVRCIWREEPRPTRSRLEQLLNDGKPFVTAERKSGKEIVYWTDALSKCTFRLSFWERDAEFSGFHRMKTTYPDPPSPTRFDRFTESIRSSWAGWNGGLGPLLWLILLVAFFTAKKWQYWLGHVALLVSMSCFAAWLVAPNYTITVRGIFSNDKLFWGTFMVIISVIISSVVLVSDLRRRSRDSTTSLQA